jgi:glutamine amidotransferase
MPNDQTTWPKPLTVQPLALLKSKNIYGTQFHPEKSGDVGLQILRNFAKTVLK